MDSTRPFRICVQTMVRWVPRLSTMKSVLNGVSDYLDLQPSDFLIIFFANFLTQLQGVVASGLAALYAANGDTSLLDQAEITLDATISQLTMKGILKESCDDAKPGGTRCDADQQIFKVRASFIFVSVGSDIVNLLQGIWTKHLQYFLDNAKDGMRTAKYSSFLGSQYSAVLRYGTDSYGDIVSLLLVLDTRATCLFLTVRVLYGMPQTKGALFWAPRVPHRVLQPPLPMLNMAHAKLLIFFVCRHIPLSLKCHSFNIGLSCQLRWACAMRFIDRGVASKTWNSTWNHQFSVVSAFGLVSPNQTRQQCSSTVNRVHLVSSTIFFGSHFIIGCI